MRTTALLIALSPLISAGLFAGQNEQENFVLEVKKPIHLHDPDAGFKDVRENFIDGARDDQFPVTGSGCYIALDSKAGQKLTLPVGSKVITIEEPVSRDFKLDDGSTTKMTMEKKSKWTNFVRRNYYSSVMLFGAHREIIGKDGKHDYVVMPPILASIHCAGPKSTFNLDGIAKQFGDYATMTKTDVNLTADEPSVQRAINLKYNHPEWEKTNPDPYGTRAKKKVRDEEYEKKHAGWGN